MPGIGPESSTGKADDVGQRVDIRLFRYEGVLSFVAHRVLNNHLEAEDAVRNCLKTASSTVPRFESEGAFRSWLVRVSAMPVNVEAQNITSPGLWIPNKNLIEKLSPTAWPPASRTTPFGSPVVPNRRISNA